MLGAQQARDTPRVELLNQHAGELGWTISEVVFDARGWIILYEHPPVEPSTLASESSDDGVVEVGGRAGGSDAFSEDAQDAQQGLVAGQSEVVPTLWGEGGTGWASSTADAPSEEVHQEQNQGQISSPDPLADELLRQGFWRIQDSPGEYFNWLVFPSPGIELPVYAENSAVGYAIPRLPYEQAWMRPLGQPQTEDYWSVDVGRRRITRWHLRRRTLLFDPNHENLALPNIALSDRRLTRLVVRYADDQSNVRVLQDFRSEGRISPLGTAKWVGSTTFTVL